MRLGAAKDGEFPSPWPQDGYGIGASQPLAPRMEAGRGLLHHLAPVWIAAGQPGSHPRPAPGESPFWAKDYFEHRVRDSVQEQRIVRYIEKTPLRAGCALQSKTGRG